MQFLNLYDSLMVCIDFSIDIIDYVLGIGSNEINPLSHILLTLCLVATCIAMSPFLALALSGRMCCHVVELVLMALRNSGSVW